MRRAIVIGCLVGLVGVGRADDAWDADAHAQSSATVYLETTFAPSPTVPIRIGADAALRVHRRRFALEVRLGAGGAGSVTALGMQLAGHVGGSAGVALALGKRVVVSPMVAYDVFALWDDAGATIPVHYLTIEIPLAIVLARGVVIEPFAQVGMARYHGATDPAIVVGPRIGIVF